MGSTFPPYGFLRILVVGKPILKNINSLYRLSPYHHCTLVGHPKSVIINLHFFTGDIGAVFSVPAAVHIKAMTTGRPHFNIMSGNVFAISRTSTRYGMAIVIEKVVFN